MIYTVTLNPSVDYFVTLDNFRVGEVNRVQQDKKMPGGKGINVSRVLKRFGIDSLPLGFIGGFTGSFIQTKLEHEHIKTDFIEIPGETRINVKIKADQESELNGGGPVISEEALNELLQKLSHLKQGDWLILSGSVPKTLPSTIYQSMSESAKKKGAEFVVDTTGDFLKQTLAHRPFLIKPNRHELEMYFNETCQSLNDIQHLANRLLDEGPQNVLVSMGGEGALLVNEKETLFAEAPKGNVRNSVGAGDSLVAGFIGHYAENRDLIEAFRFGIASGSATAFSVDLCERNNVEALLPDIKIQRL